MVTQENPIYSYKEYLKEIYGAPTYRIGVDGGFSCPHRSEGRSGGGCYFCEPQGGQSAYIGEKGFNIENQIKRSAAIIRKRYRAEHLLLYFQAYTSTYSTVENLKKIYDYALSIEPFKELIVSTRPDTLTEECANLLASYKDRVDVWVEVGAQSLSNKTLQRVNRGHSREAILQADTTLKERGIKRAYHLIFGLPGESWEDIEQSVSGIAALHPEGIKLHNFYIPETAEFYKEWQAGELALLSVERYIDYLVKALRRLPKESVIIRMVSDLANRQTKVPGCHVNKTEIYKAVKERLTVLGASQGDLFRG